MEDKMKIFDFSMVEYTTDGDEVTASLRVRIDEVSERGIDWAVSLVEYAFRPNEDGRVAISYGINLPQELSDKDCWVYVKFKKPLQ